MTMTSAWTLWIEGCRLGFEAQRVIAMRMLRISAGGAAAEAESRRMISEKLVAGVAAQTAAFSALASGKGIGTATARALAPVNRTVRANHRRLSRAKRIDGVVAGVRRLATVSKR
jgi:hypothetical protein